jgi:hypothetical protein
MSSFTNSLYDGYQHTWNGTKYLAETVTKHPKTAAIVGGAIAAPITVGIALPLLGFGSIGISAGSTAAAWMATYGGAVPAGGIIATCTSIGMAGFGTAGTVAAVTTGALAGGATVAAVQGVKSKL